MNIIDVYNANRIFLPTKFLLAKMNPASAQVTTASAVVDTARMMLFPVYFTKSACTNA